MRSIVPVSVWKDGVNIQANALSAIIISDNLSTQAIFYFKLLHVADILQEEQVDDIATDGNLTMSGQDYQNWGNTGDINDEAYQWIAGQLNLTLVYV